MARYVALAHHSDDGAWGVSFPDFPGCIAVEPGFDSVVDAAAQALRFHVEGMIEDGEPIPAPRALEDLRADPEFAEDFEDALVTLVPLLPPRAKQIRVNVSLDTNLLVEIDKAAHASGVNRSEFLAEGARRLIVDPSPPVGKSQAASLAHTRPPPAHPRSGPMASASWKAPATARKSSRLAGKKR